MLLECYDVSDGGKLLRQNATFWLAPWHNYNHDVELVWKHDANLLFAPFASICTHNKFIIKYPSPHEPTLFMLLVAKAYPLFKPTLLAAMTRLKEKERSAVTNRRIAVQDLLTLCEFIIPSVRKRENLLDVDR